MFYPMLSGMLFCVRSLMVQSVKGLHNQGYVFSIILICCLHCVAVYFLQVLIIGVEDHKFWVGI